MNDKRFMDVEEISEYLGISKWLIYKYVKNREMPFIPFGRLVRFDRHAIERWAEKRSVQGFRARPVRVPPRNAVEETSAPSASST